VHKYYFLWNWITEFQPWICTGLFCYGRATFIFLCQFFVQNGSLLHFFLCADQVWLEISSIDYWFGPPCDPLIRGPPIVISKLTPRSHNRDSEYCILSEEWGPVQKNPQQSLAFCTFGGHTDSTAPQMLQGPYPHPC
jgi:hypothetical protein